MIIWYPKDGVIYQHPTEGMETCLLVKMPREGQVSVIQYDNPHTQRPVGFDPAAQCHLPGFISDRVRRGFAVISLLAPVLYHDILVTGQDDKGVKQSHRLLLRGPLQEARRVFPREAPSFFDPAVPLDPPEEEIPAMVHLSPNERQVVERARARVAERWKKERGTLRNLKAETARQIALIGAAQAQNEALAKKEAAYLEKARKGRELRRIEGQIPPAQTQEPAVQVPVAPKPRIIDLEALVICEVDPEYRTYDACPFLKDDILYVREGEGDDPAAILARLGVLTVADARDDIDTNFLDAQFERMSGKP